MTSFFGTIALSLGLCSLFVCLLSLLVLGVAAPLGLLEINLSEEIEDFSAYIDTTMMSLVALPGRALRCVCSLILFALFNTVQTSRFRPPTHRATCRSRYQSHNPAAPHHSHLACTVHLQCRDDPARFPSSQADQAYPANHAFPHRMLGESEQELGTSNR